MATATATATAPAAEAYVFSDSVAPLTAESDPYQYQSGFGGAFETEAMEGALPKGQNSPQRCPLGLYAEQLSGTAFTVPRAHNQRSWLYRIRPSVCHDAFVPVENGSADKIVGDFSQMRVDPNQMRWQPPAVPDEAHDFVQGMLTYMGAGSAESKTGLAIHYYTATVSMSEGNRVMQNADGDMLIVPQQVALDIVTEFGRLRVRPREIAVVQRGIRFQVNLVAEGEDGTRPTARGYICELYEGAHFDLPNLGPIGSNGLANARDFLTPVAAFEDEEGEYTMVNKFMGRLFEAHMDHSPFDVVAWHGDYAPYKYNLDLFNCMNTVTYDHPDPSIYTVLTCQTNSPGVAAVDFVIFPPRWMVMEHSFRPPYYHRNCMSEFMGMIYGKYDAKEGFVAGGASLHSCMTPHGPDTETFVKASAPDLEPQKFDAGLAFMFETTYQLRLTPAALEADNRELTYQQCWQGMPKLFGTPAAEAPVLAASASASATDGKQAAVSDAEPAATTNGTA